MFDSTTLERWARAVAVPSAESPFVRTIARAVDLVREQAMQRTLGEYEIEGAFQRHGQRQCRY